MTNNRRSRRWCFRISNPTEEDNPEGWSDWRYLVWQKEQGEHGERTIHLQGYVVWNQARTFNWVKCQHEGAHWEQARGNLEQNIAYCTKEETRIAGPWIRGHKPQAGKRNDIHDCTDMLDRGASLREVALAYPVPYVKYHNGFKSYRLETAQDRSGQPNIIILWGPTGCGKSKLVYDTFPQAYRKPKGKWWDGYHTQDTVVFDDFYSWITYDEILRILDWYPLMVEIKNGYVRLVANTFVFTSNKDPMLWYVGGRDGRPERNRNALWRRFKDFGLVMQWSDLTDDFVSDLRFNNMVL